MDFGGVVTILDRVRLQVPRLCCKMKRAMASLDYRQLRKTVSMTQVLGLLDFAPVESRGDQVRGACPIHRSTNPASRSFSANLKLNTYRCFTCKSQGNHLDLWIAVSGKPLFAAALELCEKLSVEPPRLARSVECRTEKRNP